jgi:hypothetical protein
VNRNILHRHNYIFRNILSRKLLCFWKINFVSACRELKTQLLRRLPFFPSLSYIKFHSEIPESTEQKNFLSSLLARGGELISCYYSWTRPPLWSSGQSSWLHNGDVLWFLWGTNWIDMLCRRKDRLCGLVVRVLDYRCRGPGFDSRALQKKSSGSRTGSIQPREYNWGATW